MANSDPSAAREFSLINPGPPDHPPGKEAGPRPLFLQANYFPMQSEGKGEVTVVEGELPPDLQGVFTRIGPNPRYSTSGIPYHPFDGDGMVHSIHFVGGGAALPPVRDRRLPPSVYMCICV
jgi:hypothetical protein